LKADACALSCLYEHELRHGKQCSGKIKMPPSVKNTGAGQECDAYYIQMVCLLEAVQNKNCKLDAEIKKKITECTARAFKIFFPLF